MIAWRLDHYEAWAGIGLAANTRAMYCADVAALASWAAQEGLTTPAAIDRSAARRWGGWMMDRGCLPQTLNRHFSSHRHYWGWALRRGLATLNPWDGFYHRYDRRRPHVPSYEYLDEVITLPAGAEADPWEIETTAVLELLYGSGLRANEAAGLDVDDIDLARLQLLVLGKGSKERMAPMSEPAAAALERHLAARPQLLHGAGDGPDAGALFLGKRTGRRITTDGVRRMVKRRSHGTLHPHQLRHACATHMYDNGAGIEVIQQLLGHADMTQTAWYMTVSVKRLAKVVDTTHPRG